MKPLLAVSILLLLCRFAYAQDSATQAAQQAQQAAQLATQQAQDAARQARQDATEANRQASEANHKAMDDATRTQSTVHSPEYIYALPPKFSVKSGHYPGPITVRITTPQRDAVIYYTTDGWKPTTASPRYRGPISINQTTTLNAVVVLPESTRTIQASAQYVIAGTTAAPAPDLPLNLVELPRRNGVPFLPEGISISLSFVEGATSQKAAVGDRLALSLTRDLLVGNVLVAAKGSAATGTIIQVNRSGMGGAPGTLVVELDALVTDFGPVPLNGSVIKEGDAKLPNAAFLIPVVGETQIFRHGAEAVISPGAFLVASVAKDTPLQPKRD